MRRFALAVIIGLLTFSVSGVYSLVINEPCTGYEAPGSDDAACPPTCVPTFYLQVHGGLERRSRRMTESEA